MNEMFTILLSSLGFFLGGLVGTLLGGTIGMALIMMKAEKWGVFIKIDDGHEQAFVNTVKKNFSDDEEVND